MCSDTQQFVHSLDKLVSLDSVFHFRVFITFPLPLPTRANLFLVLIADDLLHAVSIGFSLNSLSVRVLYISSMASECIDGSQIQDSDRGLPCILFIKPCFFK